jgi:hypothetical protein
MLLNPEYVELKEKAIIKAYTFAGPTAGNQNFAAYTENTFKENCKRYTNGYDIVCYTWNEEDLKTKVPVLYYPDIELDRITSSILKNLAEVVEKFGYIQPGDSFDIPSKVNTDSVWLKTYITQEIYQHVCPYTYVLGDIQAIKLLIDIIKSLLGYSMLENNEKEALISAVDSDLLALSNKR